MVEGHRVEGTYLTVIGQDRCEASASERRTALLGYSIRALLADFVAEAGCRGGATRDSARRAGAQRAANCGLGCRAAGCASRRSAPGALRARCSACSSKPPVRVAPARRNEQPFSHPTSGPASFPPRNPGHLQVPRDLPDGLPLEEMLPPDPPNSLHCQHPPPTRFESEASGASGQPSGGQFWTPIPWLRGSKLHAE
jgi:hypothetical protein